MDILSQEERSAIKSLANGNIDYLEAATAAFHRATQKHSVKSCVELLFMNERLSANPDLVQRAHYRQAVLEQVL